jgi:hypothetical protein
VNRRLFLSKKSTFLDQKSEIFFGLEGFLKKSEAFRRKKTLSKPLSFFSCGFSGGFLNSLFQKMTIGKSKILFFRIFLLTPRQKIDFFPKI